MSEIEKIDGGHVERKCCISHEGKTFCSGGSYLMPDKYGFLRGILYLYREKTETGHRYMVGTWDGKEKVPAVRTNTWRSNFGDIRSSFRFTWHGVDFSGINAGWGDIVRCKELKPKRR
jgi:hypothetical protein